MCRNCVGEVKSYQRSLQPTGNLGQTAFRYGPGQELVLPPHQCKAFLVCSPWLHGHRRQYMNVLLLSPWMHGLQPRKRWRWHQLLSGSIPNGHLSRVSRRLGWELFHFALIWYWYISISMWTPDWRNVYLRILLIITEYCTKRNYILYI